MRFTLLGGLEVHARHGLIDIGGPKARTLLAALLLQANRPVSAETLMDVLWGDRVPPTARASLGNHVARLRRCLVEAADAEATGSDPALGEGPERLQTTASGYMMYVGPGELDTIDFDGFLEAARAARCRQDWPAVLRCTTAATSLWRGRPLIGTPADQLRSAVQGLVEGYRDALEWRFDAALRTNRVDGLIAQVSAAIDEFPLVEAFHVQRMRFLLHSGRHAEALAAYQGLRCTMAEELGMDPSPEAQQVHQLVLEGASEQALAAPAPRTAAAQLETEQGGWPPQVRPAQLPADIHDFTGRANELALLLAQLRASQGSRTARMCVISGPGGMGKTTLAVHAAHLASDLFPDGQLYVNLGGVDGSVKDPADVLAGFLRDLGVEQPDIPVQLAARSALLRTLVAGRRLLMVLDNARDAAQVRSLLPGSGPSAVVVTSRGRLASLSAAHRADLGTLPPSDAHALLAVISGRQSCDHEPEATRAVLDICAGLPLALRIAGARLASRPGWTMSTLAAKLADRTRRLDELRIDDLALRACFDVSYAHLSPNDGSEGADRAFRLLGLAPAPDIGLRAAAALLGQPVEVTEKQLEQLVDACLLASPTPARYRMHDLVLAYARELVMTVDHHSVRRDAVGRVSRWYLHSLLEADATVFPGHPRPQPPPPDPQHRAHGFTTCEEAVAWLEAEQGNLVPATRLAAEYDFHAVAWRIPATAWAYHSHTSRWDDWLVGTELGLHSARADGDLHAEATLLSSRGAVCSLLGDWDQAHQHLSTALEIRRRIDDRSGQVASLSTLGLLLHLQGHNGTARQYLVEALDLATTEELLKSRGSVLGQLAVVEGCLGNLDAALRSASTSATVARMFHDHRGNAHALTQIGVIHLKAGRPEQAVTPLREAAATARQAIGSHVHEATASALLALALDRLGDSDVDVARERLRALLPTLNPREADVVAQRCREAAGIRSYEEAALGG